MRGGPPPELSHRLSALSTRKCAIPRRRRARSGKVEIAEARRATRRGRVAKLPPRSTKCVWNHGSRVVLVRIGRESRIGHRRRSTVHCQTPPISRSTPRLGRASAPRTPTRASVGKPPRRAQRQYASRLVAARRGSSARRDRSASQRSKRRASQRVAVALPVRGGARAPIARRNRRTPLRHDARRHRRKARPPRVRPLLVVEHEAPRSRALPMHELAAREARHRARACAARGAAREVDRGRGQAERLQRHQQRLAVHVLVQQRELEEVALVRARRRRALRASRRATSRM